MRPIIRAVQWLPSFKRDLDRLPENIRQEAIQRVAALVLPPVPSAWRFHRLHGYKPGLYTIDVWTNKSYKASFHLDGDVAVMRRVGTPKTIDRTP